MGMCRSRDNGASAQLSNGVGAVYIWMRVWRGDVFVRGTVAMRSAPGCWMLGLAWRRLVGHRAVKAPYWPSAFGGEGLRSAACE